MNNLRNGVRLTPVPVPGLDLVIRHVGEGDHEAVHAMLTSPHVLAGSLRVPFAPLHQTRARLTPERGVHQLAAEADGQVVGFGELVTYPDEPRQRHSGEINLVATRADHVRRGVGRALMEAMIELAENWLNLSRLTLIVFTDNDHAIKLYQSLGFAIEGTMPRVGYGAGAWMDAHVMGRLRDR
ncbi:acetyltransferase [Acrocarpospora phusangensis]|uniref:Acetyltransferase n=1 Tax=Acrocarpospora phusangensis TaxID=1070424 RepID=A0A919URW5_9ACTN|nr:GNAT family N-acetyltransferase [Acrocarpospora phusangensis]GIH25880.1 acetyltransferase [Acrocarpospora phusangensis]